MAGLILSVENLTKYADQVKELTGHLDSINTISSKLAGTLDSIDTQLYGMNVRMQTLSENLLTLSGNVDNTLDRVGQLERGLNSYSQTSSRSWSSNYEDVAKSVDLSSKELKQFLALIESYRSSGFDNKLSPGAVNIVEDLKRSQQADFSEIAFAAIEGFSQAFLQETGSGRTQAELIRWTNSLVDTVKKQLGIASPSKVFLEVGKWVIQGLTEGLDMNDPANKQAAKVAQEALEAMEKAFKIASPSKATVTIGAQVAQNALSANLSGGMAANIKDLIRDFESLEKQVAAIQTMPLIKKFIKEVGKIVADVNTVLSSSKDGASFIAFSTSLTRMIKAIQDIATTKIELPKVTTKLQGVLNPLVRFLNNVQRIQETISKMKFDQTANAKFAEFAAGIRAFELAVRKMFEFDANLSAKGKTFMDAISNTIANLKQLQTELSNFATTSPTVNLTNVLTMIAGIDSLTKSLRAIVKMDASKLKSTFVEIKDGLQELTTLPTIEASKIENIQLLSKLGRSFEGVGDLQAKNTDGLGKFSANLMKSIKPFEKLKKVEGLENLGYLVNAFTGLIDTFKNMGDFQLTEKTFGIFTRASAPIRQLVPVFGLLAKALNQFNKIELNPAVMKDAGPAIKDLVEALDVFRNVKISKADLSFFGGSLRIIIPTFKLLGAALRDFVNKIPRNAQVAEGAEGIRRLVDALKDLDDMGDIKGAAKKLSQAAPTIGKALQDGLNLNTKGFFGIGGRAAKEYEAGFTKTAGIRSPSTVMAEHGVNLARGLELLAPGIFSAIGQRLANKFIDAFFNTASSVYNIASLGFIDKFRQTFENLGSNLRNFGRDFAGDGRDLLQNYGLQNFVNSSAVQTAAVFEQTLTQIKTFGSLSSEELTRVQNQVLQFSADTIFDPQQSAAAFLDLQKAGLDVAQAQQALGNIGNLAASGQLSLEQATLGVVSASQVFNLSMSESAHTADVFAQAANLSTADAGELIQGMGNVGPIAAQFGLSFEETIAILAKFNDSGIRGAEAGTQLKSMLTNLTRPTEDVKATFLELGVSLSDGEGKFKNLDQILGELRTSLFETKTTTINVTRGLSSEQGALAEAAQKQFERAQTKIMMLESGLTTLSEKQKTALYDQRARAESVLGQLPDGEEVISTITRDITRSQAQNFEALQKLAGTYGQAGLAILLSDDENAIQNFIAEMDKLPTAAETSASMMDTFKGAMDSLKGSIDTLVIKSLIPLMQKVLKPLIQVAIRVVNAFVALPQPILTVVAGVAFLASAIATLVGGGMILIGTLTLISGYILSGLAVALTAIVSTLFNPFGLILGFTAFVAALSAVVVVGGALIVLFSALGVGVYSYVRAMLQNETVIASFSLLGDKLKELWGAVNLAASEFVRFFSAILGDNGVPRTAGEFNGIIHIVETLTDKVQSATNKLAEFAQYFNILADVVNLKNTLVDPIAGATSELTAANAEVARLSEQLGGLPTEAVNTTITIASGDTLSGLAAQAGMTVAELRALNPDIKDFTQILDDGTKRIIPVLHAGQEIITGTTTQIAQSSPELVAALERQRLAQEQVNTARERERRILKMSRDEGETYYNHSEREMNKLSEKVRNFSETSLGQKIFGTDRLNVDDFILQVQKVETYIQNIYGNISKIFQGVNDIFKGDGLKGIQKIGKSLRSIFRNVVEMFGQLLGMDIGGNFLKAFSENATFAETQTYLIDQFKNLVKSILKTMTPFLASLLDFTITTTLNTVTAIPRMILDALGLGFISDAILNLNTTIGNAAGTLMTTFMNLVTGETSFKEIGTNIINGLVDGLLVVPNAILDVIKGMVQTVKDYLGIASPSTMFFDIGKDIIQGLINGVSSIAGGVADTFTGLWDGIRGEIQPDQVEMDLSSVDTSALIPLNYQDKIDTTVTLAFTLPEDSEFIQRNYDLSGTSLVPKNYDTMTVSVNDLTQAIGVLETRQQALIDQGLPIDPLYQERIAILTEELNEMGISTDSNVSGLYKFSAGIGSLVGNLAGIPTGIIGSLLGTDDPTEQDYLATLTQEQLNEVARLTNEFPDMGMEGILTSIMGSPVTLDESEGWGERIGRAIGQGLRDGLSAILSGIAGIFLGMVDAIKSILGIQSPSVVFYGIGFNLGQGLIQGLHFVLTTVMPTLFSALIATVPALLSTLIVNVGAFLTGVGLGSIVQTFTILFSYLPTIMTYLSPLLLILIDSLWSIRNLIKTIVLIYLYVFVQLLKQIFSGGGSSGTQEPFLVRLLGTLKELFSGLYLTLRDFLSTNIIRNIGVSLVSAAFAISQFLLAWAGYTIITVVVGILVSLVSTLVTVSAIVYGTIQALSVFGALLRTISTGDTEILKNALVSVLSPLHMLESVLRAVGLDSFANGVDRLHDSLVNFIRESEFFNNLLDSIFVDSPMVSFMKDITDAAGGNEKAARRLNIRWEEFKNTITDSTLFQTIATVLTTIGNVISWLVGRVSAFVAYLNSEEMSYIVYLFKEMGVAGWTVVGVIASMGAAYYLLFQNVQTSWYFLVKLFEVSQYLSQSFQTAFAWLKWAGAWLAWIGAAITVVTFLIGALKGLAQALSGVGQILKGLNTKDWDMFYEGIARLGSGIVLALVGGFKAVISGLVQIPIMIADALGLELVSERLRNVVPLLEMFMDILNNPQLFKVIGKGLRGFFDALKMLPVIIQQAFSSFENFKKVGSFIIQGLIAGLKFGVITLPSAIIKLFTDYLLNPVLEFLGIASPAKLFIDIGIQIVMGLIGGIAGMLTRLPELFWNAFLGVIGILGQVGGMLGSALGSLGSMAGGAASAAGGLLSALFGDPIGFMTEYGTKLLNAINQLPTLIGLPSLSDIGTKILDSIFSIFGVDAEEQAGILSYGTLVKDKVIGQIQSAFSLLLAGDFSGAIDSLFGAIKMGFDAIVNIDEKLGLTTKIKDYIVGAISGVALLLSDGTALQTAGSALLGAIGSALGFLFSAGEGAMNIGTAILDFIAGGISSALAFSFTIMEAGMDLASGLLGGIIAGVGDIASWTKLNIIDPIITAFQNGVKDIALAFDEALPNELTLDFGTIAVPNVGDPFGMLSGELTKDVNVGSTTIDLPDNPFQSIMGAAGLAKGGLFDANKPYEILEQRKNVPFELMGIGNRTYMMANQPGVMKSPLAQTGPGAMGSNTTYLTTENITVNVNGSGLGQTELQGAVRQAIRDERQQNPIDMRLKRQGI